MGGQLEPSNAPVLPNGAAQPSNPDAPVAKEIRAQTQEQDITVEEAETLGFRTFFAQRAHANTDFIVVRGEDVHFPVQAGMPPGIQPVGRRDGDVHAQFVNSVLVTDDPRVIKWCEDHPKVCRDANDKRTPGWAALKEMQVNLANREAQLPEDFDVDETMFPEALEGVGEQLAAAVAPEGGHDANAEVQGAIVSGQKETEIQKARAKGQKK